jgi:hypothetical protein
MVSMSGSVRRAGSDSHAPSHSNFEDSFQLTSFCCPHGCDFEFSDRERIQVGTLLDFAMEQMSTISIKLFTGWQKESKLHGQNSKMEVGQDPCHIIGVEPLLPVADLSRTVEPL